MIDDHPLSLHILDNNLRFTKRVCMSLELINLLNTRKPKTSIYFQMREHVYICVHVL